MAENFSVSSAASSKDISASFSTPTIRGLLRLAAVWKHHLMESRLYTAGEGMAWPR